MMTVISQSICNCGVYRTYVNCDIQKLFSTQLPFQCFGPKCGLGETLSVDCRCIKKSTCPIGFTPVKNSKGQCSCEKKTQPQCPSGLSLYRSRCECTGSPTCTCPRGSTISLPSSGSCTAEPFCPFHGDLRDCKCVTERPRECSSGSLSLDGCECQGSAPKCFGGCDLNEDFCRCIQPIRNSKIISLFVKKPLAHSIT